MCVSRPVPNTSYVLAAIYKISPEHLYLEMYVWYLEMYVWFYGRLMLLLLLLMCVVENLRSGFKLATNMFVHIRLCRNTCVWTRSWQNLYVVSVETQA